MAKQNNTLTEIQTLEGIYEHLSTIDELSTTTARYLSDFQKSNKFIIHPSLKWSHSLNQ